MTERTEHKEVPPLSEIQGEMDEYIALLWKEVDSGKNELNEHPDGPLSHFERKYPGVATSLRQAVENLLRSNSRFRFP